MTPFLQLILALIIIIAGAKVGGWLAGRLRQPAVLGELLVGLLLGPSLLDLLSWPVFANAHEPELLHETVSELAGLGVICLMFLAGLEIDLPTMLRGGRASLLTGLGDVSVSLILIALATLLFGYQVPAALFVGIVLTATSVGISAQTLLELGKLRTPEGLTLLSAAVLDDLLVILLLAVFTALTGNEANPAAIGIVLLQMIVYLGLAVAGSFLLPRLADWVDRQAISEGLASLVLVTTLLFAWSAEVVGGLAAITGAFIAGLGFGRSHLHDKIRRVMHPITYALLVPIFFVHVGLEIDLHQLTTTDLPLALALVVVAILAKVLGCGLGARLGGLARSEALRVGVGMVSRGEVSLIVAAVGAAAGLIQTPMFSVVTLVVLVTALVTPPLLRLTFCLVPTLSVGTRQPRRP